MAPDGLQLLDVHEQAAVAVEQHHACGPGRAAATPMANEMPLPMAPNSRMVRNRSCGATASGRRTHEQWPEEFTSSQSAGRCILERLDRRRAGRAGPARSRRRGCPASRRGCARPSLRCATLCSRAGSAAVSASTPRRASARR